MSRLTADPDYQVEFYIESLDSMRFVDQASRDEIESSLVQEYQKYKLDAIIVMGPEAIKMMSQVSGTFHPDVPMVICGSSEGQAGHLTLNGRFTGAWFKLEPEKTLEAALRLVPGTQHVVVVSGSSSFDKGVLAVVRAALLPYSKAMDVRYLVDLDMSGLLEQLRHLPSHTIVLYTSFFSDARGNQFVNATTALPLVSEAANAPVFGMSDTYIEHGIVGGYVISFAQQGKIAAEILLELFRGKSPVDIPVASSSSVYMFDWRQMQRWRIKESRLPPGSVLLNREPTLWERATWSFLGGGLVVLVLGWLTAYLLYEQRQLRRSRTEQLRLSGMLISAQEDERSRLAAELHDDFSQRLALLSLGMETVAELLPTSTTDAKLQLDELLTSADELGADLHTLSHRLHSYTLERLGLVAGVRAFCKEFGTQHGLQVVLSHENVPRSIPPDVALCFFRIVQESLRNVKKHSGASQARISLSMAGAELHLSVSDDGAGFDRMDLGAQQGLGLYSMEERARLIKARFEIHSELQQGTLVQAWVQLPPEDEVHEENQLEPPSVVSHA